jgi:hypothetical protein
MAPRGHLHRLENERFSGTRAFIQEKLSPGLPGLFFQALIFPFLSPAGSFAKFAAIRRA